MHFKIHLIASNSVLSKNNMFAKSSLRHEKCIKNRKNDVIKLRFAAMGLEGVQVFY